MSNDNEKNKMSDEEAMRLLREREEKSGIKFDNKSNEEGHATNLEKPKEETITSLGKSEEWKARQIPGNDDRTLDIGWKPFPVEGLPSGGLFYPEGATVAIRPASVEEIRHFSTIDENDPLDLDDKLNMVVSKCIQVKFQDRHATWKDLKEEDRFCLVFAVRDLTFKNGENRLFLNIGCGMTCLGDGSFSEKIEMKNDNFDYYNIDQKLMDHYNRDSMCFEINNPKVGQIKIHIPSLGVTTFIKNYIRDKIRKQEFYDKTFLKVAPFLFPDWRTLNETVYKKAEQDSYGWNSLRLSAIVKMAEMLRFGVKTKIVRQCTKCGAEVSAQLTFPGGVRSLFLYSDPLDEILGKNK